MGEITLSMMKADLWSERAEKTEKYKSRGFECAWIS
jgi:hypothetical protein